VDRENVRRNINEHYNEHNEYIGHKSHNQTLSKIHSIDTKSTMARICAM